MVAHCILFLSNYSFLLAEAFTLTSILNEFTNKNKDILITSIDLQHIMDRSLTYNMYQTMIQVTNTMSRVLIFYVSLKFAQFCERQRMLQAEKEPQNNTSVEGEGQPGALNAAALAIDNERPPTVHLSVDLDDEADLFSRTESRDDF